MDDLLTRVRSVLSTTVGHWQTLVETIPPDLLVRRPAPGEWSALQCVQHLLDTERQVFPARVEAFLAGRDFVAFDPKAGGGDPTGREPVEIVAEWGTLRVASLAALSRITPSDLARSVRHEELGPVSLGELLNEWAAHDLMHTVQAERALMQPFIAGCGAWRPYFADHVVEERGA